MPLHVLHVIPSVAATDGGPSRALALMERGLREAGIRVTTLTSDFDADLHTDLHGAGGAGHRIHFPLLTKTYKIVPRMVRYLKSEVRSFDVVHIHSLFSFSSTIAAWLCRLYGVPYIIRPLGTLSNYGLKTRRKWLKQVSMYFIERDNLRRASVVHFTSQMERDEALRLGVSMRSIVIPIGVAAPENSLAPVRDLKHEHPKLRGRRIVLYLSRVDRKKNMESLIEAFTGSSLLREKAALVIAGDGDANYVAALKESVAKRGLADVTTWLGHVDGDKKASAFAAADIFCLPSHSENFGIAAVEAMLEGLPLVIGKGVAIAADVDASGAGISVSPDATAVRNALECLVEDTELTKRMSSSARQLALKAYSVEAMARQLIDLYLTVSRQEREYEAQRGTLINGGSSDA